MIDINVVINSIGAGTADCPAVIGVNSFMKRLCISNYFLREIIAMNDEFRFIFGGKERNLSRQVKYMVAKEKIK